MCLDAVFCRVGLVVVVLLLLSSVLLLLSSVLLLLSSVLLLSSSVLSSSVLSSSVLSSSVLSSSVLVLALQRNSTHVYREMNERLINSSFIARMLDLPCTWVVGVSAVSMSGWLLYFGRAWCCCW